MKHFIVDEQNEKQRLDKFLASKLELTRSQIKKAILNGSVLVNKKPVSVHEFLRVKDIVAFDDGPKKVETAKPKIIKQKFDKKLTPKIIKKTKNYIIIDKPAGLLVHPTHKNETDTLVDWLVQKFPEIMKIADPVALQKRDDTFRSGIVHRLDREVSGVMLIARTQTGFEYYKEQFKQKNVDKEYLALVHGVLPDSEGEIDFEISRKTSGEKMASHPNGSGKGKPALTRYEVLEKFKATSLVSVNILTGRTNQIRVHFFALGNPIVGDQLYKSKTINDKIKCSRAFLHAAKLGFTDMTGEKQEFESALPEELDLLLQNLESK
jgi:23S rRNA pseudouridine1911/1915/1917 synthase